MRLFVKFAKKYKIWFEVCGDGNIGDVSIIKFDYSGSCGSRFGSKAAYDWLVKFSKKGVYYQKIY